MEYRPAKVEEAELLSDLAIESKGYWGYPNHLLDIWRKDLRIEEEYIETNVVRTIWENGDLVGFFALTIGDESELEHLWLRPKVIGTGIGKETFSQVVKEFRERDIQFFDIVSDPNAENFYQ
jgi:GNAT superfamily N-acetyltransferase